MKAKSEVKALIVSFYNMVFTQFNVKIKCFRSDNTLEFKLSDFYSAKGIIHQTSCVYTPQQNSVVERKHQHILSTARALQIQSNLPLYFWGDCVLTAVYLINRLPSPLLQHKTPYELLFGKVPSYSHLRTFGCLCFASTTGPKPSKFSPRARKCVFIGYPYNIKGYKVFDLLSHTVFVFRDVVFHETIFPFSVVDVVSSSSSALIPLPIMNPIPPSFYDTSPHCSSLPSPSSYNISDDTIIDIHHDVDEDLPQDLPEAPDELLVPNPHLRRSTRVSKPPSYLQAYHCSQVTSVPTPNLPQSGTSHPLSSFLSYDHLSPSYKSFCCSISTIVEPQYYSQAVSDPKWQAIMDAEIVALETNHT